jgi:hypothetical protein
MQTEEYLSSSVMQTEEYLSSSVMQTEEYLCSSAALQHLTSQHAAYHLQFAMK